MRESGREGERGGGGRESVIMCTLLTVDSQEFFPAVARQHLSYCPKS